MSSSVEENTAEKSLLSQKMSANIVATKEWLMQKVKLQSLRPWGEFVNTNSFNKPNGVKTWSKRAIKNIENYQTNYLFVFVGLLIYCIVTSPLMLIALAVFLGCCYVIHVKNETQQFKVMGRELSHAQQYGIAALLSFPLFFIAGAGSAVFWVLGVSFFLVGLHASFHRAPDEDTAAEQPFMETV